MCTWSPDWRVASTGARIAVRSQTVGAADRSRSSLAVTTSCTRGSTVLCGDRSPSTAVVVRGASPARSGGVSIPDAQSRDRRAREVVIVVESRQHGGSLITVTEAIERNVPLMAVPGGVTIVPRRARTS
jgi:hypothetical protein